MKISNLPKTSRPRERFLELGPNSLSDAELFALILRTGNKNENIIEISNKLLSIYSLEELQNCSLIELQKIKGIGEAKAMQLSSMFELFKRMQNQFKEKIKISSAKQVFELFKNKLKDKKQEHFYILLLDTKNKVIKQEKISSGILDASIVHPREIFNPAIKNSSSRIILVHNHPSGDPTPSKEDLEITKNLIQAGELLGIEILDHIIIGENTFWSYIEN